MPKPPEQDADPYGGVTARYYDAAYAVLRAPSQDVAFYVELARAAGGPVLELACGTGRVLLEIARQGIACAGVDLSPRMLARLRAKGAPPSLRLVQAPMQRFDLGSDRFALIYSAFRGFQHLYTRRGPARVSGLRAPSPGARGSLRIRRLQSEARPDGSERGARDGGRSLRRGR